MCGIAGKLYFDAARAIEPSLLRRMCSALAHRGPDDGGMGRLFHFAQRLGRGSASRKWGLHFRSNGRTVYAPNCGIGQCGRSFNPHAGTGLRTIRKHGPRPDRPEEVSP